jgi:hypothetical protein
MNSFSEGIITALLFVAIILFFAGIAYQEGIEMGKKLARRKK